jgi:hypothetical protein
MEVQDYLRARGIKVSETAIVNAAIDIARRSGADDDIFVREFVVREINKVPLLRELFKKYLTEDSETKDMGRTEFNQAIFDKEEGWGCFVKTDLYIVLDKFDMAVKELQRIEKEKKND